MRLIFTFLLVLPLWGQSQTLFSCQMISPNPTELDLRPTAQKLLPGDTLKSVPFCRKPTGRSQPLLVVDDRIWEMGRLGTLNPNDIESVSVLKGKDAVAIYGSEGKDGVIIIRTKPVDNIQFTVKDSLDRKVIPGATVTFTSGNDTLMFSADDGGKIIPKELKRGKVYNVSVTAIGYSSYATKIKVADVMAKDLLLLRDEKTCEPVVLVGYGSVRKCCCIGGCYACIAKCEMQSRRTKPGVISISQFNLFPNPVTRGRSITIESISDEDDQMELRILDLSGKLVTSFANGTKNTSNRWVINTDSRWTAGIYIVQMVGANGRVMKQGKLLVQ